MWVSQTAQDQRPPGHVWRLRPLVRHDLVAKRLSESPGDLCRDLDPR